MPEKTIFMKIIDGEIPSYKIYENEKFYSFLDVYPETKGHTLVIPKKPYRWVYDVPEFGEYWETALLISRGIMKALSPEYISFQTFGLQVPHAHIHIKPRYTKSEKIVPLKERPSDEEMHMIARTIREAVES